MAKVDQPEYQPECDRLANGKTKRTPPILWLVVPLLSLTTFACRLPFIENIYPNSTNTPTPFVVCTPPLCKTGEGLTCPTSNCPGGCGVICAPQSKAGTALTKPPAATTAPAAVSVTQTRTPGMAATTSRPQLMCTPPLCKPGEVYFCPSGDCPGGCGTGCATPTPRSGENTGYKEPVPTYYPCPNSPSSRLIVNQYAAVGAGQPPNRLRFSPSATANIIGSINPGELVQLLEGPQCANGWIWWKVRSLLTSVIGWTAEGDKTGYWLEPRFSNSGYVAGFQNAGFLYHPDLARSTRPKMIPASTTSGLPYVELFPQYILFDFDGYPLSGVDHKPVLMVFPVDDYIKINPGAAKTIETLKEILKSKPVNPAGSLPLLPLWNAAQLIHTRPVYLEFQNGSGIRYLTQYAQGITVINNNHLFYTFQGLTRGERFYISVIFPVSHGILPLDASTPPPGLTWEDLEKRFKDYLFDVSAKLDAQYPASFKPDLSLMDSLVLSLQVR